MITLLIDTLSVSRIQGIPLTSNDQLLLVFHLVGVVAARCSGNTHELVIDVKDKVVLPHQSSTNNHLTTVLDIHSDTISSCLFPIQVLAGVPVQVVVFLTCSKLQTKDWEGSEEIIRSVRELFLAVREAQVAFSFEIHSTPAVIFWVQRAKPVKMQLDGVVSCSANVRKRCATVNECNSLVLSSLHLVIIHHHTTIWHFEVGVCIQHLDPCNVFIVSQFFVLKMPCVVIASDLEVASILTQTHGELSLFDDALLLHHVVDRLKPIQIHSWFLSA